MSNLLSTFESMDLSTIKRYCADREQETLHLEFKTMEGRPERMKADLRRLSKVISGFANSDGGITVWGIQAKKDSDEIDAAQKTVPVQNVRAMHSRFESVTGDATSPIVDGVQHRAIEEADGAGFLVTYVPASDAGPHMAKFGDSNYRYYKRSGDSFYPMEHFDLADMFGRRPSPRLSLQQRLMLGSSMSGAGGLIWYVNVVVGLSNSGRGIAKFPWLAIEVVPDNVCELSRHGLDGNRGMGLPRLPVANRTGARYVFGGGNNDVVHAGSHLEVAAVDVKVAERIRPIPDVTIKYEIRAEGTAAFAGQVLIPSSEFLRTIRTRHPDAFPGLEL